MNLNNNQQTVYNVARSEGATDVFAKIVISQFEHESNAFTSPVYKAANNPLGMKMPKVRKSHWIQGPSTRINYKEGTTPYAQYASLSDATHDLFNWLRYNNVNFSTIDTPEKYALLLKAKGYYGDSIMNYTNALRRFYNLIQGVALTVTSGNGTAIAMLLIFIAIGLYFII